MCSGEIPSCHGISSVPSSVESRWEELSAGHTIVPQSMPVLPPIPPPPNRGGSQVSQAWGRGWFSSGRAHLAPGMSTVLVPLPFFHPGQSQLRAAFVRDWAKSCILMTSCGPPYNTVRWWYGNPIIQTIKWGTGKAAKLS